MQNKQKFAGDGLSQGLWGLRGQEDKEGWEKALHTFLHSYSSRLWIYRILKMPLIPPRKAQKVIWPPDCSFYNLDELSKFAFSTPRALSPCTIAKDPKMVISHPQQPYLSNQKTLNTNPGSMFNTFQWISTEFRIKTNIITTVYEPCRNPNHLIPITWFLQLTKLFPSGRLL